MVDLVFCVCCVISFFGMHQSIFQFENPGDCLFQLELCIIVSENLVNQVQAIFCVEPDDCYKFFDFWVIFYH